MLAFVYLIWLLLAFLLFMLFFGATRCGPAAVLTNVVVHFAWLGLLVAGTSIGAMLAALIFAFRSSPCPS